MKTSLDDPGLLDIPSKIPVGSTLWLRDGTVHVAAHLPDDFERRVLVTVLAKLKAAHPEAKVSVDKFSVNPSHIHRTDTEIEVHVVYRPCSGRRICPACLRGQPTWLKLHRPDECVSCGTLLKGPDGGAS